MPLPRRQKEWISVCRGAKTLLTLATLVAACCSSGSARAEDAYKNPALPFDQRVADLLSKMTLQQKADQLMVQAPPNTNPDIPPMNWWTEGLHGIARGGGPGGRGGPGFNGGGGGRGGRGGFNGGNGGEGTTIYPDAIAMGATFDPPLIKQIASAIADEARARYDPGGGRGRGLALWCPTLNLARDPRWGRTEETFGEDPYLAGRLGVAYVQGLQGDDPKYVKTVATPKHFAGYNQEAARTSRNAEISERTLREYYLAPFEAAFVEGKALSTMSAFNAINGVPCTGNPWLLTDVLRNDWGFTGAVVCDSRAVSQMVQGHNYHLTPNIDDALAVAINAGLDIINDGPSGSQIVSLVNSGRISPQTLDRAIERNLYVRFKLGMFDPPDLVPYARIPASVVGSPEHIALAFQSACESMVLLKNDSLPRGRGIEKLLPLDLRRINSIAVIGPYCNLRQFGSYSSGGPAGPAPTLLEALRDAVGDRIQIRTGDSAESQVEAAAASDVVILVTGLNNTIERASIDRVDLDLRPYDHELVEKVVKANPATILVLEGGSAIGLERESTRVPAILMSWYSGEQGGPALAQTLLGQNNPSGRLPLTFYRSAEGLPPMTDYEIMRLPRSQGETAAAVPKGQIPPAAPAAASPGRTYMYWDGPVAYAFGHGLSYTTFSYSNLKIEPAGERQPAPPGVAPAIGEEPPAGTAGGIVATVTLTLRNTGKMDGAEVVQVYAGKPDSPLVRPLRQLVAFQRVFVPRGETRAVRLPITGRSLSTWDSENHAFAAEPGKYVITVGSASDDPRATGNLILK